MKSGDIARMVSPFNEAFPDEYVIDRLDIADDGQAVIYLVGVDSAFAPEHLELV